MNSSDKYDLLLGLEQRVPLMIYDSLALLLIFTGNSAVLYSSLRYNAIKLDQISLIFIQNLAITDLLMGIFFAFPIWSSVVAGRFVLGDAGCFMSAQPPFIPWIMNSLLVLGITAYRMMVATNPFARISCWHARLLCTLLWAVGTSVLVIQLAYGTRSEFEQRAGKCVSSIYKDEKTADIFLWYVMICLSLVPLCLIILMNGALGFIAVRTSRCVRARAHYKGLIMVCALSGLFAISWLPWGVSTIAKLADRPITWPYMRLVSYHFILLNSVGNPILYTLTNRRFARFITQMCRMRLAEWTVRTSSNVEGNMGAAGREQYSRDNVCSSGAQAQLSSGQQQMSV